MDTLTGFHTGLWGKKIAYMAFELQVKGDIGCSQVLFQHLGLPYHGEVCVIIKFNVHIDRYT